MTKPTITEWAQSKYGFFVDRHWHDGRWVKRKAPIALADYHADILEHVFSTDEYGTSRYDTVAWCEPAKSGKTAIAGLVALYTALHIDENSSVILASNKQNQAASLMFKSVTDAIKFNQYLRMSPRQYRVLLENGNQIRAIPSNSKTESGARFVLAAFDELWAYEHTDAIRLFAEFKIDPTRQMSMRFCVGYGGYAGESDLWEGLLTHGLEGAPAPGLEHITNPDGTPACWINGRTFVFWSSTCRQPWQTPAWIASQQAALLPSEFNRMIKCEFSAATSAFLPDILLWDRLVKDWPPFLSELTQYDRDVIRARDGITIDQPAIISLDLATGGLVSGRGGDSAAIVVGTRDPDNYDAVAIRRAIEFVPDPITGLVDFGAVDQMLYSLYKTMNVVCVCFDPHAAGDMRRRHISNAAPWWKAFDQKGERTRADTNLYSLIMGQRLHHDGDPNLRRHIMNAAAKATGENSIRLVKKNNKKKIDLAVATSMCAETILKLRI